jgi:hypothetical protein
LALLGCIGVVGGLVHPQVAVACSFDDLLGWMRHNVTIPS